jgi:hypothetical protein
MLIASKKDAFASLYKTRIICDLLPSFRKKDFVVVTDFMMCLKMGKRIHLCEYEADSLAEGLNQLFERKIDVPRIKHGKTQTIDTLINEEALLLAKYLRNENKDWIPRIGNIEKNR